MNTQIVAAAAGFCLLLTGTLCAHAEPGQSDPFAGLRAAQEAKAEKAEKAGKDDRAGTSAELASLTPDEAARAAGSARRGADGATPYAALIARYAGDYGVPVSLARAVIRYESNFNPRARGAHGEIGLMQIKPATARMMGYTGSAKGLYDPATNLRWGMKYLAAAHELGGGDTCGTILRYNAGHAATRMNKVSARYCSKVQAFMQEI